MWFWANAHWLIQPWGLWHWMSGLVIGAKSKQVSNIYHQYTSAEKSHCQHFNLFFPKGETIWDLSWVWGKDGQYYSLWAWLKSVYWESDYQFIEKAFFLLSVTQIIINQPQGGRISSYLQFHSSRFKSVRNLSSSALASTAAAGGDRSRRHNVLSLHSSVLTPSPECGLPPGHEGITVWEYEAGPTSHLVLIQYQAFTSLISFALSRSRTILHTDSGRGWMCEFGRCSFPGVM